MQTSGDLTSNNSVTGWKRLSFSLLSQPAGASHSDLGKIHVAGVECLWLVASHNVNPFFSLYHSNRIYVCYVLLCAVEYVSSALLAISIRISHGR